MSMVGITLTLGFTGVFRHINLTLWLSGVFISIFFNSKVFEDFNAFSGFRGYNGIFGIFRSYGV